MDETTEEKVAEDIKDASNTILEVDTMIDKDEATKNSVKKIGRCFYISAEDVPETVSIKTGEGYVVHYYIELMEDKSVSLEVVGENGEPTGKITDRIPMAEFLKTFKACSRHICHLRAKTVEEISKKMAQNRIEIGEKHLENGELEDAEDKFNRALKFDEESIQATLGLGKTKMEQKKVSESMAIFKKLSEQNSIYEKANKHTLNEFAIYMRRNSIFDLAVDSYEKAISIDPDDSALFFNLARAYGLRGLVMENKEEARENINIAIGKLHEALAINSDFPEAKKFLRKMLFEEEKIFNSLIGSDATETTEEKQSAA